MNDGISSVKKNMKEGEFANFQALINAGEKIYY